MLHRLGVVPQRRVETRVVNRKGAAVSEFPLGTFARKNEERQCWSSARRFGARLAIILVKPEPLLAAALWKKTFVVKFNFKQHMEMPIPLRCIVSVDLHTKSPRPDIDGGRRSTLQDRTWCRGAPKRSPNALNDHWAQFLPPPPPPHPTPQPHLNTPLPLVQ